MDGRREDLASHLGFGLQLVRRVERFGLQLELGDIELPPSGGSAADRELLRATAPLYLAAELESTRLLPVVEVLAGLVISGGLPRDLGSAGPALAAFWRARQDRLTVDEREAIFGRVFGKWYGPALAERSARNLRFDPLMIEFAASLADFGRGSWPPAGSAEGAPLTTAGRALAENLLTRAGGIVTFAAKEILETTGEALEIVKDPDLQRALGASSVWQAVRLGAVRYLGGPADVSSHVTRGKAGMHLLAWLAGNLGAFESFGGVVPAAGVITHAVSWLQATLALEEQRDVSGGW